jgi:hypothetical protein
LKIIIVKIYWLLVQDPTKETNGSVALQATGERAVVNMESSEDSLPLSKRGAAKK